MESAAADWIECTVPGWRLAFRYPTTDSAGQPVIVEREDRGQAGQRIHVMAGDRDEIYFEVVRVVGATAPEMYASMREGIPRLYDDVVFDPLVVDDEIVEGSFTWADQRRLVRFFELPDATYRVILRPVGAANSRILETVERT